MWKGYRPPLKQNLQNKNRNRCPSDSDGIVVDYYGSHLPINQVANVTVMDARTLNVQPWEKNMPQTHRERAIIAANIGINPQNDGGKTSDCFASINRKKEKN